MRPDQLALGTAQFGMPYGIANTTGQVSAAEARAVLADARRAGIDTIDTAVLYGASETTLGAAGVEAFRVITKLPGIPERCLDVVAWVTEVVSESLARLRIGRLAGLLLHCPADLVGPSGDALRRALYGLRSDGLAEKIGYSIYAPGELDRYLALLRPDIVQAPFNVFDRRLQTSGWLARLVDAGVEVHVRSAFLQGLLVVPQEAWPARFAPWFGRLAAWHKWCMGSDMSPAQAALLFAATDGVDRVVVGVDSRQQLQQLLGWLDGPRPTPPPGLECDDENLINPIKWSAL